MGKIYYNQANPKWANYPYTHPQRPNATCRTSGCGPTCAAMIVSSAKEIIRPDEMCNISKENGFRASSGTSDGLFTYVSNRWGIEMKRLKSSYEAHQACKDGYFVVIACGPGLWSTNGHYILAVGASGDKIQIFDPNLYCGKFDILNRQGKVELDSYNAWVQIDTFKQNSNAQRFFAFKVGIQEVEPTVQETKAGWVNTKSLNLNVRSDASINSSIVGSLEKGTQVIVYEERNGWSRIGNGKWISSQYVTYSKPAISNTVGQLRKFSKFTNIWSNPNLTGTRYDYKLGTTVKILENTSATVDKINVPATGRIGYVSISSYRSENLDCKSTVGQTRKTKKCNLYSNKNLTGRVYNYKENTTVKILENVSSSVDKVLVNVTGRVAYISVSSYK